jgi:hypothetical protein
MTTEDNDSIPDEPEELALWRDIASFRDALCVRVRESERAERIADAEAKRIEILADPNLIWVGEPANKPRPEDVLRHAAEVRDQMVDAIREDARDAATRLRQLDTSIREREGKKLKPPRRLLDELREPQLRAAALEVQRFIDKQTETNAWFARRSLEALRGETIDLDAQIADARRWIAEGNRSGTVLTLVNAVVNGVAGRGRDARVIE